MTRHYPDLGSASDWLKICFNQSERVVPDHQYGISDVPLTSFRVETRFCVAKCRLFSQVIFLAILTLTLMYQPEADWFMSPKILLFHSLNI